MRSLRSARAPRSCWTRPPNCCVSAPKNSSASRDRIPWLSTRAGVATRSGSGRPLAAVFTLDLGVSAAEYRRGDAPCKASSRALTRAAPIGASVLTVLGDQQRQFERLLMIQAWIDRRTIGALQITIGETACTAGAFRHVIPGQLDVHTAQVGPGFAVDSKRALKLAQNILEAAGLKPAGAGFGVAMHRVAYPQHRLPGLAHGIDCARQRLLNLLHAEAVNKGQAPRLIVRIQGRDETLQPARIHGYADFHSDRIGNATEVLNVCAVQLCGAHANPWQVGGEVVPALLARDKARLRLLVQQVQTFVTCVEIRVCRFVHRTAADAFKKIQRIRD